VSRRIYGERFYRRWQTPVDLESFVIREGETQLTVFGDPGVRRAVRQSVLERRAQIAETIASCPEFASSHLPIALDTPYPMIHRMIVESARAGVGPMAGVAGAVAEFAGRDIGGTGDVIIENGGDLFIRTARDRALLVYAGEDSPFRDRIRIRLRGGGEPWGVCTSSGQVGHSWSYGRADAAVVIARSALTADVFATAIGNRVHDERDVEEALAWARGVEGLVGGVVLIGARCGLWGDVELAGGA
jgi:ApbE superfamily uncharacterized protein (UPF0280 family)